MLATPIHATCKTEYSDTYARNSGDEHCIHKQDKAKHKNTEDRNTAQRHNCRDNQDHASKPKHPFADLQLMGANIKTERHAGKLKIWKSL